MKIDDFAASVDEIYSSLEGKIFYYIVKALQRAELPDDKDALLEWQLKALSQEGALTKDVLKVISNTQGVKLSKLKKLMLEFGISENDKLNEQIAKSLHQTPQPTTAANEIANGLARQAFREIDNAINETLISRNHAQNPALKAYRGIINKTVVRAQTGEISTREALNETVYEWQRKGLDTPLIDKAGRRWNVKSYARTVITTTTYRASRESEMQLAKQYGTTLAVMTSHPAARPACAWIQGQVVNTVPPDDPDYNDKYDGIYNHGYGTPAGALGINCKHMLRPYFEGISTNYQQQYDPEQAIANGKLQQQQRALERRVRQAKDLKQTAQQLGDDAGAQRFQQKISAGQAKLRQLVDDNDILHRDYSREQPIKKNYNTPDRQNLPHGMTSQEYVEAMIKTGKWSGKINPEKQAPHMEKTRAKGKSYFYDGVDAQKLLDKYRGTGEIFINRHGEYDNRETIVLDHNIGIDYNSGKDTNLFKIHYSKKRTHLSPIARRDEDENK